METVYVTSLVQATARRESHKALVDEARGLSPMLHVMFRGYIRLVPPAPLTLWTYFLLFVLRTLLCEVTFPSPRQLSM